MALLKGVTGRLILILSYAHLIYLIFIIRILDGDGCWVRYRNQGVEIVTGISMALCYFLYPKYQLLIFKTIQHLKNLLREKGS